MKRIDWKGIKWKKTLLGHDLLTQILNVFSQKYERKNKLETDWKSFLCPQRIESLILVLRNGVSLHFTSQSGMEWIISVRKLPLLLTPFVVDCVENKPHDKCDFHSIFTPLWHNYKNTFILATSEYKQGELHPEGPFWLQHTWMNIF